MYIGGGGVIVVTLIFIPGIYLDIKINDYGIPVLSFLLSIIAVMSLSCVSAGLEYVKPISCVLAYCGKCSLCLMFIHQFIHFNLLHLYVAGGGMIIFLLTVSFSLCFYYVVSRWKWGRILFCGERS